MTNKEIAKNVVMIVVAPFIMFGLMLVVGIIVFTLCAGFTNNYSNFEKNRNRCDNHCEYMDTRTID